VARSRSRATSQVSVVIPGSSTSFWRSQRTAYWNSAVEPSPVFRACARILPASSASAEAKSFSPNTLAISQVCSSRVLSRSV
jgi:hypothetical protein